MDQSSDKTPELSLAPIYLAHEQLARQIQNSHATHPRSNCPTCGRQVINLYPLEIVIAVKEDGEVVPDIAIQKMCIICLHLAREQGHVDWVPPNGASVLKFPEIQAGGTQ